MKMDTKLFDDLARVAGGAVSLVSTVRKQVQSDLRGRMDSYTDRMDLVTREEIDRLQAMVATFRTEQDALKKRIAELEAKISGKKEEATAPKEAAKKTTPQKKTAVKAKRK